MAGKSFLGSLGVLPVIDFAVQAGRGAAGAVLGQSYDVYRLTSKSNGQLIQAANRIARNYPVLFERYESKSDIEANWMTKIPLFKGTCDAKFLQIGDVLVETGPPLGLSDGGAFTFVDRRPLRANMFVQTPIFATLTRPDNNPTGIDVGDVPQETMMKEFELILALVDGAYYWKQSTDINPGTGDPYEPAGLYIGLQAENKKGEKTPPDERLPGDVQRPYWNAFLANLPGAELAENDVITGGNGDRYTLRLPAAQFVGLQGVQLLCERELV